MTSSAAGSEKRKKNFFYDCEIGKDFFGFFAFSASLSFGLDLRLSFNNLAPSSSTGWWRSPRESPSRCRPSPGSGKGLPAISDPGWSPRRERRSERSTWNQDFRFTIIQPTENICLTCKTQGTCRDSWVVSHLALNNGILYRALGCQFAPWWWQTLYQTQAQHLHFFMILFDSILSFVCQICHVNCETDFFKKHVKPGLMRLDRSGSRFTYVKFNLC